MAQFTRLELVQIMKDTGMVPLFYNKDVEISKKVITACYKGGARLLEFTARGDFAHEVFGKLVKYATKELPGMAMGVGSVTDATSASGYMSIGANFIVTPVLREDIAIICNRRKVLWSAGCGALTEIAKAEELGCEIIKLFPGSVYGPKFVKAVRGPQPWTSIMPTGGVSPTKENLEAWFKAGVACVGMGSNLMAKNTDGKFNYKKIESLTRDALKIIKDINK